MEALATSKEVAAYLGVHPQSMDRWASRGEGPPFSRIGGSRRYDWSVVRKWVADQTAHHQGPTYQCNACGKPVRTKGHLVMDYDDLHRYEKTERERLAREARKQSEAGTSWVPVDLDAFLAEGAQPTSWGVFHHGCDPKPERNGYYIEIERANTWPKLADWAAHLIEKGWANSTSLGNLLRRAGGEGA